MADGEWRMDDLIRFLYATLGDTSAFLKLNPDYHFLRALGVLSALCGSALTLISVYLRLIKRVTIFRFTFHDSRFTIHDLREFGPLTTHC